MTEHQTRVTFTYRETMKARIAMTFTRSMAELKRRDQGYMEAYRAAMAGGDRFVFTRATRAYLKALRKLSANAKG